MLHNIKNYTPFSLVTLCVYLFDEQVFSHTPLCNMTATMAKKIGRKQSLLVAGIAILVIETIQLIIETKGDFANGMLFFMQRNLNPIALMLIGFLLSLYVALGGLTGDEILLKNKNYIKVSIRNSFATLFSYFLFLNLVIGIVRGELDDVLAFADKDIRNEVMLFGCVLFLLITITWIIIGYRIRNLKSKTQLM